MGCHDEPFDRLRDRIVEEKEAEPKWEIGKHVWDAYGGRECLLCRLKRDDSIYASSHPEYEGWLYEVNGRWTPAPTPCVPRLAEPFPGFYTTKEVAEMLWLSVSNFVNRSRSNVAVPAAISRNNVYYWREDQIEVFRKADASAPRHKSRKPRTTHPGP